VSLRWLAPNPADFSETGSRVAGHDSRQNALSDFEWKELITSGTHLNQRWAAQVDVLATKLKELQNKNIAVLWTPYPQPNGKQYWWAAHPGIHGSASLYRMLFDRLVNYDGVHNLIWIWQAASGGFGPGSNGPYSEFFPGFLYVDGLELSVSGAQSRFRADTFLQGFAVNKVIGIRIDGPIPDPALFARETNWAWFLLAQPLANPDATSIETLRVLYNDPRVLAR
jgi:mannan endo-1,4-beta-mannosidase